MQRVFCLRCQLFPHTSMAPTCICPHHSHLMSEPSQNFPHGWLKWGWCGDVVASSQPSLQRNAVSAAVLEHLPCYSACSCYPRKGGTHTILSLVYMGLAVFLPKLMCLFFYVSSLSLLALKAQAKACSVLLLFSKLCTKLAEKLPNSSKGLSDKSAG